MTDLPPNDLAAEQVAIGAMLSGDEAALADVVQWSDPDDYFRPAHQVIYETVIALMVDGLPHDAVAVGAALADTGQLAKVGGGAYLHTLIASVPTAANGGYYARIVARLATRRRWLESADRIRQIATTGSDPDEIAAYAELVADEINAARDHAGRDGADRLMTAAAFAGVKRDRRPPVIDGLLDHEDRAVIVGVPGMGKTTFLLQIAFATGAGVHPFAWDHDLSTRPRVLVVDLQNRPGGLARKFDTFLARAEQYPDWDPDRVMVWSERRGLDLRGQRDQARLAQVIRKAAPDLIVAGPVNEMLIEDDTRGGHQTVARWWDRMQARHGFALVLEHHPPMKQNLGKRREIRGSGSAVWEQWPEFTILLEPAGPSYPAGSMRLGRQRGDREEGRLWPERIERFTGLAMGWPWEGHYPAGTPFDLAGTPAMGGQPEPSGPPAGSSPDHGAIVVEVGGQADRPPF